MRPSNTVVKTPSLVNKDRRSCVDIVEVLKNDFSLSARGSALGRADRKCMNVWWRNSWNIGRAKESLDNVTRAYFMKYNFCASRQRCSIHSRRYTQWCEVLQ